jgi:hypothetical protein
VKTGVGKMVVLAEALNEAAGSGPDNAYAVEKNDD